MSEKKLIIVGPDRIICAIRELVEAIWEANYNGDDIDTLNTEIEYAKEEK